MAVVVANMSMSLDGFIAEPSGAVGPLFDWYRAGPVAVTMAGDHPARHLQVSAASADYLHRRFARLGAIVTGRRLFDIAQGWGGAHPAGVPVFVVTHHPPPDWPHADFTFVEDGVPSAVAQAAALTGPDGIVAVASADLTRQCLDAGLLDEIAVDLVPVLLGRGTRFFDQLAAAPVLLDDPEVVEGIRVTHLTYRVRRPEGR